MARFFADRGSIAGRSKKKIEKDHDRTRQPTEGLVSTDDMPFLLRTCRTLVAASLMLTLGASCSDDGGGAADINWSAAALTPQTVELGGVSVRWSLPEGLKKDPDLSSETKLNMQGEELSAPRVFLKKASIPATKLENAAATTGALFGKDSETLEKVERDGRFVIVLSNADRSRLMVSHYVQTESAAFECVASQRKKGGIADFDALLAKFHEICGSVALP